MFISTSLIFVLSFCFSIIILYISSKYFFRHKKSKNYVLIKDYPAFIKLSKYLNSSKQIGVDTEHFHDSTYKGTLCLIQLHTPKYPFGIIIDLIVLEKEEKIDDKKKIYSELKSIFENKKIEKIFHSCYNDLRWISETINTNINNIFDTQYMDNYIETKSKNKDKLISQNKNLNILLKKYLNMKVSEKEKKKLQRSDWLSRPLSESQLNYAANDALYLIELRNKMYQILNDDKEFNKVKKEFNIDIKNKLAFRKSKKEEEFKEIAGSFINENMTVVTEKEYVKLAKDLFTDLLKKTDEFASQNNIKFY